MSKGNTKVALRLLSKNKRGSILRLSDTVPSVNDEFANVLDVLKSKHPPSAPPSGNSILEDAHDPPTVHPVIFDSIMHG